MTFSMQDEFEEQRAAGQLEPFPFVGMDGNTYHLKNIRMLSAEEGERMEDLFENDLRQGMEIMAADEASADAIAKAPIAVLPKLFTQYQEHCGTGELLASLDSSASTVRQSRPTLPASSGRKNRRRR
jgi:hypothetical protein